MASTQNWFDRGGDAYARHRPDYPAALAAWLADVAPDHRLAIDVGCGNGQFTRQLATRFRTVLGFDPSVEQIAHAEPHPRIRFAVGAAEDIAAADGTASLVAAAQSAHWFSLRAFYAEVRRIAAPGALLALVSYGVARFDDPDLAALFDDFYRHRIGPYWPPERRLVDTGYADIAFPFRTMPTPAMDIVRTWSLDAWLGYVSTWSAVRHARDADRGDIVAAYERAMRARWGDPAITHTIRWPVTVRLGAIDR